MPTSDIQEDEGQRDNNLSNFVAVQTPSGFVHYPLTHYPTQWHKLQLACVCRRPWYIFTHTHDMMRVEFDYIYDTSQMSILKILFSAWGLRFWFRVLGFVV